MMKTLKLDKNNNLTFSNNLETIESKDAIKQDIKTLLLMWLTENPFNTSEGLNWYQLSTYNNKNDIIAEVKERILQDKRVLNINSIEVSFNNNLLNIEAELETSEGIVNVSDNVQDLVTGIDGIGTKVSDNTEIAMDLNDEAKKFEF